MTAEHSPLPEEWETRDAHDSYFEAIAEIGRQVKAGAPLPALFVPRADREWGDGMLGESGT